MIQTPVSAIDLRSYATVYKVYQKGNFSCPHFNKKEGSSINTKVFS